MAINSQELNRALRAQELNRASLEAADRAITLAMPALERAMLPTLQVISALAQALPPEQRQAMSPFLLGQHPAISLEQLLQQVRQQLQQPEIEIAREMGQAEVAQVIEQDIQQAMLALPVALLQTLQEATREMQLVIQATESRHQLMMHIALQQLQSRANPAPEQNRSSNGDNTRASSPVTAGASSRTRNTFPREGGALVYEERDTGRPISPINELNERAAFDTIYRVADGASHYAALMFSQAGAMLSTTINWFNTRESHDTTSRVADVAPSSAEAHDASIRDDQAWRQANMT